MIMSNATTLVQDTEDERVTDEADRMADLESGEELSVSPTLTLADQIGQVETKMRNAYGVRPSEDMYLTHSDVRQTLRDITYDELHNSDVVREKDTLVIPENEADEFIDIYLTPPTEEQSVTTSTAWWNVDHPIGKMYRVSTVIISTMILIRLLLFGITTFL